MTILDCGGKPNRFTIYDLFLLESAWEAKLRYLTCLRNTTYNMRDMNKKRRIKKIYFKFACF